LDNQLGHATEVLAEGVFPLTGDLLNRLSEFLRADIALLGPDGQVALSTLPPEDPEITPFVSGLLPRLSDGSVLTAVSPAGYKVVMRSLQSGRDSRFVAVAAIASLADVRAASRRTAAWFAGAAILATLLLAIAGHHLARSITLSIRQLCLMAERIADGDREIRSVIEPADELGALGDALNRMAERLGSYELEITEQSRLSALGEMAARIAHEIRNPLTAIKLHLQLLIESVTGQDRDKVAKLLEEIERLELIVTSSLSVARPATLQVEDTDLNEIIDDVSGLVQGQLAHQGIELESEQNSLPRAPLDAARVKQVLLNLINNAAAKLPGGGIIRVSSDIASDRQAIVLRVEDSGPGIPEAEWNTLFSRSGQARSRETVSGRFGLGLTVCQELIELHGGRIEVDRAPDLAGARLTVYFPLSIIKEIAATD
jgi:signal transduction histidine kinase